ncbi:MAG: efflux RND transporter permease subunit, partial [Leptospira sp.]|nr:efflux RND transporter permease subunit [Leptospira sp.]
QVHRICCPLISCNQYNLFAFKYKQVLGQALNLNYSISSTTGIYLGISLGIFFRFHELQKFDPQPAPRKQKNFVLHLLLLSSCSLPFFLAFEKQKFFYSDFLVSLIASAFIYSYLSLSSLRFLTPSFQIKIGDHPRFTIFSKFSKSNRHCKFFLTKLSGNIDRIIKILILKPMIYNAVLISSSIGIIIIFTRPGKLIAIESPGSSISAFLEFPSGSGFKLINGVSEKVEKRLAETPELSSKVERGRTIIQLDFSDTIHSEQKFYKALEKRVGNIHSAFIHFNSGDKSDNENEIVIDVLGDEMQKLDEIVKQLAKEFSSINGVYNLLLRYKNPRPELQVIVDKMKSGNSGISTERLGQSLKLGVRGGVATKFIRENREIDVQVRYATTNRESLENIENYHLMNMRNQSVPLLEVAKLRKTFTDTKIYRKNKKRTLSFSMRFSPESAPAIHKKLEELKSFPVPENYNIEFGKTNSRQGARNYEFLQALCFLILVYFMILSSWSESVENSLIILQTLILPIFLSLSLLNSLELLNSGATFAGICLASPIILARSISLYFIDLQAKDDFQSSKDSILLLTALLIPALLFPTEGTFLLGEVSISFLSCLLSSLLTIPIHFFRKSGRNVLNRV